MSQQQGGSGVGRENQPRKDPAGGKVTVPVAPVGPSDLVKGECAETGSAGPTGALETIRGPRGRGLWASPADEKLTLGEARGAESRLSPAGG